GRRYIAAQQGRWESKRQPHIAGCPGAPMEEAERSPRKCKSAAKDRRRPDELNKRDGCAADRAPPDSNGQRHTRRQRNGGAAKQKFKRGRKTGNRHLHRRQAFNAASTEFAMQISGDMRRESRQK